MKVTEKDAKVQAVALLESAHAKLVEIQQLTNNPLDAQNVGKVKGIIAHLDQNAALRLSTGIGGNGGGAKKINSAPIKKGADGKKSEAVATPATNNTNSTIKTKPESIAAKAGQHPFEVVLEIGRPAEIAKHFGSDELGKLAALAKVKTEGVSINGIAAALLQYVKSLNGKYPAYKQELTEQQKLEIQIQTAVSELEDFKKECLEGGMTEEEFLKNENALLAKAEIELWMKALENMKSPVEETPEEVEQPAEETPAAVEQPAEDVPAVAEQPADKPRGGKKAKETPTTENK